MNNKVFYKVKWQGYTYCTWEPYENLQYLSFDFENYDKHLDEQKKIN